MLKVSTGEGWRTVNPDDVLWLYRGGGDGRYTHCVLILCDHSEVAGDISNDALATLEVRLAEAPPLPPMAA